MKLKLTKDLDPLKKAYAAQVDASAEAARGQHVTLGNGQSAVYAEKERQAEKVMSDPDIDPAQVPLVALDMELNDLTAVEAAKIILKRATAYRDALTDIERKRLTAKAAISAASNPAEIEAAAVIDW